MNQTTIYQIAMNKSFKQLNQAEKDAYQNRQTKLATLWQDTEDEMTKRAIYDELHYSLVGLVNFMAYKQAEKSFSVEEEDFQGIMFLTLSETLIKFDREKGIPFQPVFLYNVSNEIKMMYRTKSKDGHEATFFAENRLDQPTPHMAECETFGESISTEIPFYENVEHNLLVDQIINTLFHGNEKKRTIVHMSVQNFKRNEIVEAIKDPNKSTDSVARLVNRTVKEFKSAYLKLS